MLYVVTYQVIDNYTNEVGVLGIFTSMAKAEIAERHFNKMDYLGNEGEVAGKTKIIEWMEDTPYVEDGIEVNPLSIFTIED